MLKRTGSVLTQPDMFNRLNALKKKMLIKRLSSRILQKRLKKLRKEVRAIRLDQKLRKLSVEKRQRFFLRFRAKLDARKKKF